MGIGTYGSCLARSFGLRSAATLISRMASGCPLAVTELRQDALGTEITVAFARDDAYLLALQLRGPVVHQLWRDGVEVATQSLKEGSVCFYDVGQPLTAAITTPFHTLLFHVSRSAIAETSKALGLSEVIRLQQHDGSGSIDPIIQAIGACLLPQLHGEQPISQQFVDHLFRALLAHLVGRHGSRYGGCIPIPVARGGLAAWQQRRAKELIAEHLIEGLALAQIAAACRLSISAFARGFRISTGVSPHEWLLRRRIDCALELMRATQLPLADVALKAGFADQSHFTRTFGKRMGLSPGAWRRAGGQDQLAGSTVRRDQARDLGAEPWLHGSGSRMPTGLERVRVASHGLPARLASTC